MPAQLTLVLDAPPPRKPRAAALRHHHVRSHQPVEEALEGEARAQQQDARVLEIFWRAQRRRLTPSEVWGLLDGQVPLLTSVRRSITNLTARGLLVHYRADRRMGPRGARESAWGLA